MGTPVSATVSDSRTYSTEQITTLAGTFAACKVRYDDTRNGVTTTSYSWTKCDWRGCAYGGSDCTDRERQLRAC